jgi:DnaJ domain
MPTWLKITSALTFIVVMIALKFVVKVGVTAFDWWFTTPVLIIGLGSAYLIDRSDARKRRRKPSASGDPKLDTPSKDIPDYYSVLGVSRNADRVVIHAAYRALAKKYHPDTTNENTTLSQRRFAEISAAYSALSAAAEPVKETITPTEPKRRTATTKPMQYGAGLVFIVAGVPIVLVALAALVYFASKPASQSTTSYSPNELSEMTQRSIREWKKTNQ